MGVEKDNRLLVVDINYLLSEFKDKPLETVKSELEEIFQVKVFFIDGSRQNMQSSSSNNYKPVYFI